MKITKTQLKQIIKEEFETVVEMSLAALADDPGDRQSIGKTQTMEDFVEDEAFFKHLFQAARIFNIRQDEEEKAAEGESLPAAMVPGAMQWLQTGKKYYAAAIRKDKELRADLALLEHRLAILGAAFLENIELVKQKLAPAKGTGTSKTQTIQEGDPQVAFPPSGAEKWLSTGRLHSHLKASVEDDDEFRDKETVGASILFGTAVEGVATPGLIEALIAICSAYYKKYSFGRRPGARDLAGKLGQPVLMDERMEKFLKDKMIPLLKEMQGAFPNSKWANAQAEKKTAADEKTKADAEEKAAAEKKAAADAKRARADKAEEERKSAAMRGGSATGGSAGGLGSFGPGEGSYGADTSRMPGGTRDPNIRRRIPRE